MLEPQTRRLFLDALRPPTGYQLDTALGTTFSLDLMALLTVPLAFTFFDWEEADGTPTAHPLALLEAVRRHAERIHLFCQAGQIAVPPRQQLLFGYLESSVIQVSPRPDNGVFHPKVWVLRFTAVGEPTRYRLLVASRNLTFDRSWDTLLVLDGGVSPRRGAVSRNHPLGDFVATLPRLAVYPVEERTRRAVEQVQAEIRRVNFELPPGFERLDFHPLGIRRGRHWPFEGRVDRLLVVSPFVEPDCLRRLTGTGQAHCLVSRVEELGALDASGLAGFQRVYVLADNATPEPEDAPLEESEERVGTDTAGNLEVNAVSVSEAAEGLHAKLFVADAGWDARIWTGSANATNAAFSTNVEFLVELRGKKSRCGVEAVLNGDGGMGLVQLLQEYRLPEEPITPDPEQRRLEKLLESVRRALAKTDLGARVAPAGTDGYPVQLVLRSGEFPALPAEVELSCWPATLPQSTARPLRPSASSSPTEAPAAVLAEFTVSLPALTSFFAFEARVSGESPLAVRFLLNLPLEGEPSGRREAVLRTLLQNREQVLRYLLLLLSGGGFDANNAVSLSRLLSSSTIGAGAATTDQPLFESLVRALDREPERLDQIAQLLTELDGSGAELLPSGFARLWEPLWRARQALTKEGEARASQT